MPDYTIGSLVKAAAVISMLGETNRGATLTEIARTTQIPRETVFRLLKSMQELDWVQQAGDRWLLGAGLWELVQKNIRATIARYEDLIPTNTEQHA